ncbi:MAG: deoxyribodipyrimidine photo-lyase [Planctomycetes bacterium]|nr:deoxyribodipyrimidine photo-lyase [Planctomycetota bacterium]
MNTLVWFRNDLRTADHPALHHAARRGPVVGMFLDAIDQWREHDWGDNKIDFVRRNVAALSASLAKLNIPLRIVDVPRFDGSPAAMVKLARAMRCDALAFNDEYEVNEHRRDAAVAAACERAGIEVYRSADQTVVRPTELRTGSGGPYSVFTPYKNAWLKRVEQMEPITALAQPMKQAKLDIESDAPRGGEALADRWPGGEDEAQRRLTKFIAHRIKAYKDQRDQPAADGTSAMSPYLACGAISAKQCYLAAKDLGGEGAATWISELIWREFYRQVMVHHPRVSMGRPFKRETRAVRWRDDEAGFEAWREGRTGVPIVDAAMRQLIATGWMHNRCRMIAAMFLTKNLLIDWRRGERHFMQHLVDGDLANNNGGWQWSASTGTDAAPYFRVFNPLSQSARFDPDGAYIRAYVPELAQVEGDEIHDPLPLTRASCGYPMMIVDLKSSRQRAIDAFANLRT